MVIMRGQKVTETLRYDEQKRNRSSAFAKSEETLGKETNKSYHVETYRKMIKQCEYKYNTFVLLKLI